jgi:hypothetical protein
MGLGGNPARSAGAAEDPVRQSVAVTMCPACGFDELYEEPLTGESASDEICPCCSLHFGYDDAGGRSDDFHAGWRNRWVRDGCPWFSSGRRPGPTWSAEAQVRRVTQT